MSSPRRSRAAILLVVAWLLAAAYPAGAAARSGRFVDDDGSRFESAIDAMAAAGVMKACNPPKNNRFCPGAVVDRGDMAVFLARAFKLTATSNIHFTDVARGSARERAIDKVVTAGIADGPARSTGSARTAMSRGRMAAFLAKALRPTETSDVHFADVPKSNAFSTAINRLATAGGAISCGNHAFCPKRAITRAETAGFLQRALGITRVTPQQPAPGNPTGGATIPAGAGAADTLRARPRHRQRDARELHLAGRRRRGRQGRRDHVRLRPEARDHPHERDGQGVQRQARTS